MFRNKKTLALALCIFTLLIGGVFFLQTNSTSGVTYDEEFNQGMRNALAEINLSNDGSLVTVNASSDNLTNFIYYRSGVQFNQTNKDLLRTNEQKSWAQSKKITQAQLTQILQEVAFDKLTTLSDADIDNMAGNLCGFNAPNLSAGYQQARGTVRLRANGEGPMEPSYFVNELKSIRNEEIAWRSAGTRPTLQAQMTRSAFYNRVLNDIANRMKYLSAADPNFSGSSTNDMTPVEAMLLVYATVTDDMLMNNQSELQQRMSDRQQAVSQFWQSPYPLPQGTRAYGENGYIYATSTNLLLDNAATTAILNLIKERSNLQ